MVTVADYPEQGPSALAVVMCGPVTSSGPRNISDDLSVCRGMNVVVYIVVIDQQKPNEKE